MGTLTLIRHGQASFGKKNYDSLSALGRQQSKFLGEYFESQNITFDKIFCGDLARQINTTRAISSKYSPMILKGLNEYEADALVRYYYSGHVPPEIFQDRKHYFKIIRMVLKMLQDNEIDHLKNYWHVFTHNVLDTLKAMTKDTECNTLAITSGGPISLIVSKVLKSAPGTMVDLNLQIKNTSITKIIVTKKGLYLNEFNSTPHLINSNSNMITYS